MALIKCPECGKDASDKAPACIHCGYPLAKQELPERQWEICLIQWGSKASAVSAALFSTPIGAHYFWAEATSPTAGTYSAGCSPLFKPGFAHGMRQYFTRQLAGMRWDPRPPSNDQNTVEAHRALVELLVQDGWEPTDFRGGEWWQHSFRRPVRREEEGWSVLGFTRKWGDSWFCDSAVDQDEIQNDPEFQEALKNGDIRRESDGYWFRKSWMVQLAQLRGGQLVSDIPVGPDGSTLVTFKGENAEA